MLDGAQPGSHRQPLQLARQRLPSPKNDFAVHDFAKSGSHGQPLQLAGGARLPKNDSANP